MNTNSNPQPTFTEIQPADPAQEEAIFEIFKSPTWDTTIPAVIDSINKCKDETASYGDYPYFKIQNTIKYTPQLSTPSDILTPTQLRELHNALPYYHQYGNFNLIFSIAKHGCALKTFYSQMEGIHNSLIVIKDDCGNVFGAYASEEFQPLGTFYGTGETFLFTFYKGERMHVFNSTGANEHYIYSDESQIAFGCSDDYFSLVLENDFYSGYSKSTQTFQNAVLNQNDKFVIIKMEVWSFQEK
jgi:hypothetical protein